MSREVPLGSNKGPVVSVDLEELLADIDESVEEVVGVPEAFADDSKLIVVKEEPTTPQQEALASTSYPITLTSVEMVILEALLHGKSPKDIAASTNIPIVAIRSFIARKDVKAYIIELKAAVAQMQQLKLQDTFSKMIDARIAKCVDEDGNLDYSSLSGKDTLDIMRAMSDILTAINKDVKEDKEGDVYLQILNQVTS